MEFDLKLGYEPGLQAHCRASGEQTTLGAAIITNAMVPHIPETVIESYTSDKHKNDMGNWLGTCHGVFRVPGSRCCHESLTAHVEP